MSDGIITLDFREEMYKGLDFMQIAELDTSLQLRCFGIHDGEPGFLIHAIFGHNWRDVFRNQFVVPPRQMRTFSLVERLKSTNPQIYFHISVPRFEKTATISDLRREVNDITIFNGGESNLMIPSGGHPVALVRPILMS
jgi:hypothetical protein